MLSELKGVTRDRAYKVLFRSFRMWASVYKGGFLKSSELCSGDVCFDCVVWFKNVFWSYSSVSPLYLKELNFKRGKLSKQVDFANALVERSENLDAAEFFSSIDEQLKTAAVAADLKSMSKLFNIFDDAKNKKQGGIFDDDDNIVLDNAGVAEIMKKTFQWSAEG